MLLNREERIWAQAWHFLKRSVGEDCQDSQVLCLLAEVSFNYGDWLDKPMSVALWQEGLEYAQKAAVLEPNCPHAHYWVAVLMGKIGRTQGIVRSLFLVNPMLERLNLVLELDPNYSWAYYALGQMYMLMPGSPLGQGDRTKALHLALKAWELDPKEPEFSLLYAQLLIKNKEKEKARLVLETALATPFQSWQEGLKQEVEKLYQQSLGT